MFEIIEAAYELDTNHCEWRRGLTERVRAYWGGAASYTFEAMPAYDLSVFESAELERGASARRVINGLIRRIGARRSRTLAVEVIEEVVEVSRSDLTVLLVPEPVLAKVDEPDEPERAVARRGVCLLLPARALSERELEVWRHLTYHIKSAFRLRTALAAAGGDNAREILRNAARLVTEARLEVEAEARTIWDELVAGRWSLVDRFGADGREYLIAHRNEDGVRDLRALSDRESAIAVHLARGWSNRKIGDALGLSISVVSDAIGSMVRKLGVDSRVALVRLLGAIDPEPRAL